MRAPDAMEFAGPDVDQDAGAWPEARMSPSDRCDRCCARAQVRWVRDGQWIDTCAHHAREYGEALLEWSHWLVDRRDDEDFAVD